MEDREDYITYNKMSFEEQREYIWGSGLNKLLVNAYNIIFNEEAIPIGGDEEYNKIVVLTLEKKQYLNKLIKSMLDLACYALGDDYLMSYRLKIIKNSPEEIERYVYIGIAKYLYDKLHKKSSYSEHLKTYLEKKENINTGIFFVPPILKTYNRKDFKKRFGGMPEQIYSAAVYYIINYAVEALKNNDTNIYGKLIISCFFLLNYANYNNSAKINNKKSKIESNKDKEFDYKSFHELFISGKYDNLSYDNKIHQIHADHHIGIKKAKEFYKRAKSTS